MTDGLNRTLVIVLAVILALLVLGSLATLMISPG
jgi:hypothetical protein